ncbi:MAG TPA: glutathione S-transferase family protein [Nevskiaceae bacterium]|nr:glutathione S-transferase family protein [Nevskiaceae bacterium]
MTLKLYAFPPSPRARKPLAVLHHLKLPFELEFLDMARGAHKTPEFLRLNPNGRMPVLVDDDFVLWESNAIMLHLANKVPGNFFPRDDRARADISRWLFWDMAHWDSACATLLFENLVKGAFGGGAPDPVRVKEGEDKFNALAAVLDDHLSRRRWMVGDTLTPADFALAAPLHYAQQCRVPVGNRPHIQRWYAQIAELDAWKKSAPPPLGSPG